VRRFNEAIDEALTASIVRYAAGVDLYRDQFIGILSHDLRTPLSAITAGAALLTMAADGDPQRARVGARMLSSAQRMNRLITDLLDLTRTRLGAGIPIKRAPADLQQICEHAVLELKAFHPTAVIRYEPMGDLRGQWDADRLTQLVSNLVGNALEHGGNTVVTIVARGSADNVVLAVHNDGPPIPPEVHRSIFEPLVRHVSGETEVPTSVGLGLFIARGIVASHGGSITVSSTATEGTTFEARLPRHGEPGLRQ
jgi:signal transduction histidine kinase